MTKWSLVAELLSLVILTIIYSYYREKNAPRSHRRRIFDIAFWLSVSSIILNFACVYTISNYTSYPSWLNMSMNTAYFVTSVFMCNAVALYLFDLLLEYSYKKHCYKIAAAILFVMCTLFLAVAVSNPFTGALFSFSKSGEYIRGPLNRTGYMIMAAEIFMVILCYIKNRDVVSSKVKRVISTLPPISFILMLVQLAYPHLLLNGTIMTVSILIIYINFQNCQIEKDYLTQLGNRKSFYEAISLKLKSRQHFHIISVSLKEFYRINQKYGHQFGDNLLYMVGKWLDTLPNSQAYRFGNVSFAVMYQYRRAEDADAAFAEICSRFESPWLLQNTICKLSAACCDIIWNGQQIDSETVIEYIESMSSLSKSFHSDRMRFDDETAALIARSHYLEDLIRKALQEDLFTIDLQPVYSCREKAFCGGEALVRLKDADGAPVSPAEFIPIAEKTGLIDQISWVVLDKVCSFLSSHRDLPMRSISINLSMQQFLNPELLNRIYKNLDSFDIPSGKLKIEITERIISQDIAAVKDVMSALTEKGIGFYLDDFGTGYSNFSVVMRLPFECVKLDKSLLSKLLDIPGDCEIIRSMISMFHNSGFMVACEGIETKAQADMVSLLGADLIQGFYYAKPMPAEEFADFMRKNGTM